MVNEKEIAKRISFGEHFAAGGLIDHLPKPPGLTGGDLAASANQASLAMYVTAAANVADVERRFAAWVKAASAGGAGVQPPKGSVPGTVEQWLRMAIGLTHVAANWLGPLEVIAMHESGGNPHAINLWDSNAQRGDPSRGLMQTIGSTFRAHMLPGHGDIWNPVDNASAAIRYISGRYHDVFHTPGILSMSHGGPYKGYATGGIVEAKDPVLHVAPFRIPSFDQGGIVPGPIGEPTLAMVHGGEQISQPTRMGAVSRTINVTKELHIERIVTGDLTPKQVLTLIREEFDDHDRELEQMIKQAPD
jgi:hypothetical protein